MFNDVKNDFQEFLDMANDIYNNPELGYKEYKTSKIVEDFVLKYLPEVKIEKFANTGLKFHLGEQNKKLKLVFVAELDAVFAPSHFKADTTSGAAHNCGHYSQVVIALKLFKDLLTTKIYENFDFSISFVFVPAEEYLDLDYRKNLKEKGEITYFGGKPEGMKLGIFDEFDFGICVHSMGGKFEKRSIEITSDLAGFMYKTYTFKGKASHAGFDPFSGINAYSISTLFNVALGLLRQQINEKYLVRFNPVVLNSNMGMNVIPNEIRVGTDLRAHSTDYMIELSQKFDTVAKGCASALGGEVKIETQMGYLPFIQDRFLSSFVKNAFEKFDEIGFCRENTAISAAGDIGDLSFMFPCIQIGYSGFKGTIHGDDFIHEDEEYIFNIFPNFLIEVLKEMNGKIDKNLFYKKTYKEYEKIINKLGGIE